MCVIWACVWGGGGYKRECESNQKSGLVSHGLQRMKHMHTEDARLIMHACIQGMLSR